MLDAMSSYFSMTNEQIRSELLGALDVVVGALKAKGVRYADLRNQLVPQRSRREIALVFDSGKIESAWYGYEVASRLIPLLPRTLSCAILDGDLILADQDLAFELLGKHLICHRSVDVRHSNQLFCVYINNLSQQAFTQVAMSLRGYEAYVGHVDTTVTSQMKDWLSMTLVQAYLKSGSVILNGHEDDVDDSHDSNMQGWPWSEHGYILRSFRDMYFHLFLSYKIERRVLPGFESDTRFALAAISNEPLSLTEMAVEDADARFLASEKSGSMAKAGLASMTSDQLQVIIGERLMQSYIYELWYREEYDIRQFNIMMEVPSPVGPIPARVGATLEYRPSDRSLRLITMY